MNTYERAVIEAARKFAHDPFHGNGPLCHTVATLEAYERELAAAGAAEVDWHAVAEGDELRSRSGTFFPVTATKREWKMGKPTGNFLITVQVPAGPKVLTRPLPTEPMATVRRGAAGRAVDLLVHVFTSGEQA